MNFLKLLALSLYIPGCSVKHNFMGYNKCKKEEMNKMEKCLENNELKKQIQIFPCYLSEPLVFLCALRISIKGLRVYIAFSKIIWHQTLLFTECHKGIRFHEIPFDIVFQGIQSQVTLSL